MVVFSVDAEVNGLYGYSIAIAVTIRRDGKEIGVFTGRVDDSWITDQWTKENVLPAIKSMKVQYNKPTELDEAFWTFWRESYETYCTSGMIVIAHCPHPVETGLFRRCVDRDPTVRIFQAPMSIHDVGTLLMWHGFDPTSVDDYLQSEDFKVPFDGLPHHPMYDAIAAAMVWEQLMTDGSTMKGYFA